MAFKKLKYWFDRDLAKSLADKVLLVELNFENSKFCQSIDEQIDALELKDRVALFASGFKEFLPGDFPEQLKTLQAILGPPNPNETGTFKEYYWVSPIAKFIESYGLDYFEESMHGISEVTRRNTGEFAIRPFLITHPDKTYKQMLLWSKSQDFHLRRLASEGIRPRLPWAAKQDQFIEHPEKLHPILDTLIDDDAKYVQRSVANCINDVLKDNEEIAKVWLYNWKETEQPHTEWIIKHALRNFRKKQISWALELCDTAQ